MALDAYSMGQGEKIGEAFLEPHVAGDLAADITDYPAQPDAQEFEFAPGSPELVGMGIAADHDRGALCHRR